MILGKLYKNHFYLSFFYFILMFAIAIYNFFLFPLLIDMIVTICMGFLPLLFVFYRYNRFLELNEEYIIIKRFFYKKRKIYWQDILKIDILQQYYSIAESTGNLLMGGPGSLIFLPNNLDRMAEWRFLISTSDIVYKLTLHLINISSINEINKNIAHYSQLKCLKCRDVEKNSWKNPKRKEVKWLWKCEGTEEEIRQTSFNFLNTID